MSLILSMKGFKINNDQFPLMDNWLIWDQIAQRYGMNPKEVSEIFDDAEIHIIHAIIRAENEARSNK